MINRPWLQANVHQDVHTDYIIDTFIFFDFVPRSGYRYGLSSEHPPLLSTVIKLQTTQLPQFTRQPCGHTNHPH